MSYRKANFKNVEVTGLYSSEDNPIFKTEWYRAGSWTVERRGRGVVQPSFSSGRSRCKPCGWTQVCVRVFSFCQLLITRISLAELKF